MFLERLGAVTKKIEGALALSLIDVDGIPIESVSFAPDLDIEALAAEAVTQIHALSNAHEELDVGPLRHYSVSTSVLTLMVSSIAEGYFLLLVLDAGCNLGRARFELRRAQLLLEKDLR
jgi:predicted regulator of Ras-like GTPase activity (Roadblock/LC7/MglB family)